MGKAKGNTTLRADDATIRAAIAAERREMADLLDALPAERWDERTLCAGWRVREVAAHLSFGFRYSFGQVVGELIRARGSMDRMTDRVARREAAAMSRQAMAAALRENADHPWTPPVGGFASALGHDVVHGLDITIPLGLERRVPEDRLRIVLGTASPMGTRFFGAKLGGVRLRAEDLDWSYGTGSEVSGRAQDLVAVVFGRKVPAGRLHGEASGRFTAR
ncbi:maleylpyruvate isomerase family mycothiol-dependent enzyme [Streptomyces sp. NBC_00237]|uniref:maleylpyruvate isomerase family mycothiol-dependent enzyme n=1 Tax=Streptomyces sp. NBC_00237 TaxID=2975687 RepID=UPI00224CF040|nr:maleylpyruvate isomerase family mycothiol-dependent enzyme [Streptomyces sp. NBC_00237]MCX5207146.1 maleylpyruvate isomerase family mycothiol-dependent enzyme [Streptomyces sp. NBC_00237]